MTGKHIQMDILFLKELSYEVRQLLLKLHSNNKFFIQSQALLRPV